MLLVQLHDVLPQMQQQDSKGGHASAEKIACSGNAIRYNLYDAMPRSVMCTRSNFAYVVCEAESFFGGGRGGAVLYQECSCCA